MSSDQFPTGNVTFFFSDIESSTELWERHPDGMRTALARHDELLRTAVGSHNGFVVKTTGDGLHAIFELAATRLRLMTPQQLAGRLNDRFRLLTGGSRTALPRQQTLRALIDWSYSLLEPAEKVLFRRLSVFSGGWSLAAAEAVASADLADYDALDLLSRLVDKSLVIMEEDEGQARCRR